MIPNGMFPEYFYATIYNRYNTDYDVIMPVVEKILCSYHSDGQPVFFRTLGSSQESNGYMVRLDRYSLHQAKTLIECIYQAVLEYIKFNQTTNL